MTHLCKDCKFYVESDHGTLSDRCAKIETGSTASLVRGETQKSYLYCIDARFEENCGRSAKWFEAK